LSAKYQHAVQLSLALRGHSMQGQLQTSWCFKFYVGKLSTMYTICSSAYVEIVKYPVTMFVGGFLIVSIVTTTFPE